jgi:opine dehydrogenase
MQIDPVGGSMKIAVLGGGNGSYAAAVDLSELGHEVWLWRRDGASFPEVLANKCITVTDNLGTRDVTLFHVGDDLGEAIADADLVVAPLPATSHADLASRLAPLLQDGQVVFLPPGTLGGLMIAAAMKAAGNNASTAFSETGTLPYLTRKHSESTVTISVRATRLPTGVFPASQSEKALSVIRKAFPAVEPLSNILDGALMNAGPIIHPPLILMNAGPLEHFDSWDIHNEGTQASIRRVTDALDAERIALREALGFGAPHFPLADHYDDDREEWMYGDSSHEKLVSSDDWREKIDLHAHRYMREDIALGLVLYATLGRWTATPMPISEGLVSIASAVVDEDLLTTGRSWASLGFESWNRGHLAAFLQTGAKP